MSPFLYLGGQQESGNRQQVSSPTQVKVTTRLIREELMPSGTLNADCFHSAVRQRKPFVFNQKTGNEATFTLSVAPPFLPDCPAAVKHGSVTTAANTPLTTTAVPPN